MLKLNMSHDPYWIELDKGVRVLVRPLSTIVMQIAQNNVKQLLKDADPKDDPEKYKASIQVHLTEELARASILEWEGVYSENGSAIADVNNKTVTDLMRIWYIAQAFFEKYTSSLDALYLEGNASRLAANGISAAGQVTARDASSNNSPAPKPRKARISAPMSKTSP